MTIENDKETIDSQISINKSLKIDKKALNFHLFFHDEALVYKVACNLSHR